MNTPRNILIIRFSSYGDIAQCMACLQPLKKNFANCKVDWVTRSDFSSFVESNHDVTNTFSLNRGDGLSGLFRLGMTLRKQKYDLIYDAHNNLRSHLLCWLLLTWKLMTPFVRRRSLIRRSKYRLKRFLLFKLRWDLFQKPFYAAQSYIEPLEHLLKNLQKPLSIQLDSEKLSIPLPEKFIVLAPSAAWPMKRWPIENWKKLVALCPDESFVILGGPQDTFCQDIANINPSNIINLSGKTNWNQTTYIVKKASLIVSADTGVLHLSDLLQIPTLALLGPTAFGRPINTSSLVLESQLPCQPCSKDGRGKCTQDVFQKCLVLITPECVSEKITQLSNGVSQ